MKDEIFFRDKLEDEWEANEVYAILSECDKDFEPPLSERGSTVQKTWEKKSGDGVRNYFNEVAKQHMQFITIWMTINILYHAVMRISKNMCICL